MKFEAELYATVRLAGACSSSFLFGGYSAGWFYVANRVKKEAEASIASLNRDGVTAECANLDVRGFPFRLGVFCDSVGYGDPGRNIVITAGSLRSAAQVYQPWRVVTELDGPLRTAVSDLPPLWLDWDKLRASVRIARPAAGTPLDRRGRTVRPDRSGRRGAGFAVQRRDAPRGI